ncbi:MAG: KH domain-containing protein [Spirochaetaceae bacterium]|nr:KH domain-containing protein [Spirochaetaceae bacterium]
MEKELIEFIVKSFAADPGAVSVNAVDNGGTLILELSVGSDDVGRIIGKRGRVVKAVRTVLQVAAARSGRRAILEILDR